MQSERLTHRTVSLEHRAITVSPEGYEKLAELAEQFKVCKYCNLPYAADRPNVALNTCLLCLLAQVEPKKGKLQFIGPKADEEGIFLYLDKKGFINYSITRYATDLQSSAAYTLDYWGYAVPDEARHAGKPVILTPGEWKIHGRPGANALVIVWKDSSITNKAFVFLTYRFGDWHYLDKRQKATHDLFSQARKEAETTKRGGEYHLTYEGIEYTRYELYDEDLYPIIAFLKSGKPSAGDTPASAS
jgi:hypothetical protein